MLRTAALALASLALAAAVNAGVVTIFSTGFEPSEGYAPGQLGGQNTWTVRQGVLPNPVNPNFARVSTSGALSGSQSLLLDGTQLTSNYTNVWGETFRGAFVGRPIAVPAAGANETFTALEFAYTGRWTPGSIGTAYPTAGAQAYSGPNLIANAAVQSWSTNHVCGVFNDAGAGAAILFSPATPHNFKLRVDYVANTVSSYMDGSLTATLPLTAIFTQPDSVAFNLFNANTLAAFPSTMLIDDVRVNAVYTTTCPQDFNNSGTTDIQDIFDFLSTWFAGDIRADFNASSAIDVQDIFDFLAAWFSGC